MVKPKRKPKCDPKTPEHSAQHSSGSEHGPVNQHLLENSTKFMALNDDCILKIFEYLPLNDVCSLSQTCKRMHALGSSHFMQKYKSKQIALDYWKPGMSFGDGKLKIFPRRHHEKYVSCFAKSIRSVTLMQHFSTMESMQGLSDYYQVDDTEEEEAETVSPIQAIRFLDWKVDVSRALCTPIEAILKNVESLTIENSSINADLDGCLFPMMPKLKRLTVLSVAQYGLWPKNVSVNSIWQQPACPSLEYFAWHKEIPNYIPWAPQPPKEVVLTTEIVRFLEMNPGIKFVSLRLDLIKHLEQLMAAGVRVNELFYTVSYVNSDERKTKNATLLSVLKAFCDKQQSMKMMNDEQPIRLHLKLDHVDFKENFDQLELLAPYIVGMYFDYLPSTYAVILSKLTHLKVVHMQDEVPTELLCTLPKLEEVFVACKTRPLYIYEREICILGSKLPKLKKLYLNGYLHGMDLIDAHYDSGLVYDKKKEKKILEIFEKIDIKRKKLSGVRKLKVYLAADQDFRGKKIDYDTVQLVRSQSEAITNPFFAQTYLVGVDDLPDYDRGACKIQ